MKKEEMIKKFLELNKLEGEVRGNDILLSDGKIINLSFDESDNITSYTVHDIFDESIIDLHDIFKTVKNLLIEEESEEIEDEYLFEKLSDSFNKETQKKAVEIFNDNDKYFIKDEDGEIFEIDLSNTVPLMKRGGKLQGTKITKDIKPVKVLKTGGKFKVKIPGINSNFIAVGNRHEEKHDIKLDNIEITEYGIPVIGKDENGELSQLYEIEDGELVFTAEVSKKIEDLKAKYEETNDERFLEELGKFVKAEIKNNIVNLKK